MGIIPDKYLTDIAKNLKKNIRKTGGWMSLSPLLVFLVVYLVSSILAKDFYKIPITAAFLVASIYALLISKGTTDEKIAAYSRGAGDKNVLLMIWIFVLAGAFASTAQEIGAVDATVNLTLKILPDKLLYAGIFLASCFISMSIGTSVGTIVALVPVAAGIAEQTGAGTAFMTAIVAGGAFFGDNLSFISDTTIAATRTQECAMKDKFRVNLAIAAPAALAVTAIYVFVGAGTHLGDTAGAVEWVKLIPYIMVIWLALAGMNVVSVLALGIGANAILGFCCGDFGWTGWLAALGSGIGGMGELIIVTMLAGGMLEVIRANGGIDFIVNGLTRKISGKRGAELCIAALVSLANICTANNTIAIITTGRLARDISIRYGVDPRKSASILDTFSCMVQGIIPYGAQMLMAAGLAGVSALSIIKYLYYPYALGLMALLAILLRFPKKYS
ncbi:MAG: Na+/H+ antiporter NhaC family protein [Bacteroidetes bacterium]|uniref:Na+/H+ antiporter NhaC family protein n=1 Tax=Candidatus Cryptobacteroides excrementipullorum TaxID=2840761 RepID=A0A9D9NL15_9BACT|nr:Na+/H+ antiporter NhaC family protein [Candidatus Cryptobacteroides excrementipullorum]